MPKRFTLFRYLTALFIAVKNYPGSRLRYHPSRAYTRTTCKTHSLNLIKFKSAWTSQLSKMLSVKDNPILLPLSQLEFLKLFQVHTRDKGIKLKPSRAYCSGNSLN